MTTITGAVRKLVVCLIGTPLFVLGIILIPMPGPGLLISFLSLVILSSEFEWAKRRRDRVKTKFREIYNKAKARADKIEHLGNTKDEPK